jgi:hypothetical protein
VFIFRGPSVPNMWLRHYVRIGIGQIQEQAKIEQPPSLDQLPFALWCLSSLISISAHQLGSSPIAFLWDEKAVDHCAHLMIIFRHNGGKGESILLHLETTDDPTTSNLDV